MAAEFVNIKLEEMDAFLTERGFQPITLAGTVEKVYAKRVDKAGITLSLRVYTGVEGGESRGVGEDAIKIMLFTKNASGKICKVGGSKRVNRVKGWKSNLQARLDKWDDVLPDVCACAKCGSLMVRRAGKNGDFLGCTGYPTCKNTRNLPNAE